MPEATWSLATPWFHVVAPGEALLRWHVAPLLTHLTRLEEEQQHAAQRWDSCRHRLASLEGLQRQSAAQQAQQRQHEACKQAEDDEALRPYGVVASDAQQRHQALCQHATWASQMEAQRLAAFVQRWEGCQEAEEEARWSLVQQEHQQVRELMAQNPVVATQAGRWLPASDEEQLHGVVGVRVALHQAQVRWTLCEGELHTLETGAWHARLSAWSDWPGAVLKEVVVSWEPSHAPNGMACYPTHATLALPEDRIWYPGQQVALTWTDATQETPSW